MTLVQPEPGDDTSGALHQYRARRSAAAGDGFDELLGGRTGERPEQQFLADAIDSIGAGGLLAARAEARRLVDDDGIQYGVPTPDEHPRIGQRSWHVDPLPVVIGTAEWTALERGLQQRNLLLGMLLDDFYGERSLLRRGFIPPEVVLAHPGFIRQCDGTPGTLTLGANDLGRDHNGEWRVLADRTSAPSGAAYAMANRRIVSRVMARLHRGTDLARLRGFFHTTTAAVLDAAPAHAESPRAVLLSPGAHSETAYDQAFLASLLGIPLVEADDLTVRDGRVWIRAGGKLERVDAILRRVDPEFCDPLELRADSQLGIPGMIEASRQGSVAVVNSLGARVLENPGLAPYLGAACRALLGEDLLLTAAPTWWCGDADARSHVLAHLERLAIRRTDSGDGPTTRLGWTLSAAQRDELTAQIEAEPWMWVGQEPLPLSTTPLVHSDGLRPGRLVLRTFSAGSGEGCVVMPGGLGRVSPDAGSTLVSSGAGAVAKDVWVLAAGHQQRWGAREQQAPILVTVGGSSSVAPRVADNLFWIGRYAARAETITRLLRIADDLAEDHAERPGTPGAATMRSMFEAAGALTGVQPYPGQDPHLHVRAMLANAEFAGSVAYSADRLVEAAQRVRDTLSYDIWHVLSRLDRTLAEVPQSSQQLQPTLLRVLESLLAISGIVAESMVRDESWGFLDGGLRIERALITSDLLRSTLAKTRPPFIDGQVTEAVLEVGESIITHRRRTVAGVGPAWPVHSAVALLLLDRGNPRSVAFQIDRLADDFDLLGDEVLAAKARSLGSELASLDLVSVCAGDRSELASTLGSISQTLRALSQELSGRRFARKPAQHLLPSGWTAG